MNNEWIETTDKEDKIPFIELKNLALFYRCGHSGLWLKCLDDTGEILRHGVNLNTGSISRIDANDLVVKAEVEQPLRVRKPRS